MLGSPKKMNARNIAMVFAPNMTQMSDPLTALMHAVQVMNLLKTLIIRTLREREETATGGYSPFSSRSSDRQTNEDFDSQQEMDTSCELRGDNVDYEDHAHYSQSSGDEEEAEPLNEIEECFLRQLNEKEEEFTSDGPQEVVSPSRFSCFNAESGFSFSDSKNGSSGLSTSDDTEDSLASVAAQGCEGCGDVEMVEKQAEAEPLDDLSPPLLV